MKYILFDFNGTLLDDVEVSRKCLNEVIEKYLDRPPVSLEEYLHIFTFPVKTYYEKAGFNFQKDSFEEVGKEWVERYMKYRNECKLHEDVLDCLYENKERGNANLILSASKKEMVLRQCEELGILDCFEEILGIDHIYADGKLELARSFMKDKNPDDFLLIGDTLHDYEVARALGIKVFLVARGHQAYDVLKKECDYVYHTLKEALYDTNWAV